MRGGARQHVAELARLLLSTACTTWQGTAPSETRRARRLRRLVRYAAQYSPYYRDLFNRLHLAPSTIRTLDDLRLLPVLSSATVREVWAQIVSREIDPERCAQRRTTGTTGRCLTFPVTPLESALETLLLLRGYTHAGLRPWHRQAKVVAPRVPRPRRFLQRLGLFRRAYLGVELPPEHKVAWLQAYRPDALMCWASVLNEITLCLEKLNQCLRVPLVFASSDMLWPDIRARAQDRLQARVVDWYGATETGPIAWGCAAGALHLAGDHVVVELLDDQGRPTRRGRVVCTPLWRFGFPLLRLDLGDGAEWLDGSCPCGNPSPALCNLQGREVDLCVLPGESHARLPLPVIALAFEFPGVRQYQLVQEAPSRALLRLVTGPEFTTAVEERLRDHITRSLAPGMEVRVLKCPALVLPAGIKFTPVVTMERLQRLRADGVDVRAFFHTG